ncbi:MAG TPA: riboflavin synthase [Bryobacteraceae bacterium]|jgi:riboflavin synthase|nr:riboflavin synthase [Bryobacteraceae bacterium]
MFTGIIEETGHVEVPGAKLRIRCNKVVSDLTIGASIAVNGVCLTAVDIHEDGFSADLAPETLQRSSLGDLRQNDEVNLERPLTLQARLSGHIVQGHVDGTAILKSLVELTDKNWELTIQIPPDLDKFLVYKGSIAIDGISLTIASVADGELKAAIIPHTFEATNLHARKPGDRLNIECDVLAKHVDKLLSNVDLNRHRQPAVAP